MPLRSRIRGWLAKDDQPALEAAQAPPKTVQRTGIEYGIPDGGLTESNQGIGVATQTDRRTLMEQLYESYVACPWSWACVQVVAKTITAGGLATDWDTDTGEGDQPEPDKPPAVLALERLLAYVNPQEDIRQLMRNVITDLEVFGDAFIEVVWWGSQPVALYSLDSPSMMPLADKHGTVTGYVQMTDFAQRAEFEPQDVIHISLDAPRSGIFGVSPTQAALLPITSWLFAASCGKEMFRKGLPPQIHVDFNAGAQQSEMNRWAQQYAARNIGPRNMGTPVMTKGGGHIAELQAGKTGDVLAFLDQKRDEIIANYGVPPSKVSIIESGSLGGGTGEAQDRTFRVNTCDPLGELVMEKFNFAIVRNGFGIEGWRLKFGEVDWRDSTIIETIRDMRLRNGSWTVDRYRAEIGEPPIGSGGGDLPVLVERQSIIAWKDMEKYSDAQIAAAEAGGMPPAPPPQPGVVVPKPGQQDDAAAESLRAVQHARYRARLAEALKTPRPS